MSYYDQRDDDFTDEPKQREVSLSTFSILGIFFALALICAVCWGLGYNMGSKARTSAAADTAAAPITASAGYKPSAAAPAIQPVPGYLSQKQADTANSTASTNIAPPPGTAPLAIPTAHQATTAARADAEPTPPTADADSTPAHTTPAAAPAPRPAQPAAPPAAGDIVVQVAAVSHQEDAELLVSALKRKGYPVTSRTEPGDHYFHVQVGPFPTKAAATPTMQKLQADGYNAYIK